MRVFIYGSLKQGRGNHGVLETSNAKFVAACETVKKYTMLDFGYYPGVVTSPEATTIKGEVYEVEVLDRLDYLEGYPDLYYREEVELSSGDTAWMYLYNKQDPNIIYERVETGVW